MLGAIVSAADFFEKEQFEGIFSELLYQDFPKKVAEGNLRCFRRGFEEVIKG